MKDYRVRYKIFLHLRMPKIYNYLGFIFFFYSNEHLPIHCHVQKGDKEVKAEIEFIDGKPSVRFLKIRSKEIFDQKDLNKIKTFINTHAQQIVNKWRDFFILGKSPNFEKVKVKK